MITAKSVIDKLAAKKRRNQREYQRRKSAAQWADEVETGPQPEPDPETPKPDRIVSRW
jgi:hypothetical protein